MKRSVVMLRLMRLMGPLWGLMSLAVLAGVAGHLCAIAVPTAGMVAVLSAAGFGALPAPSALLGAVVAAAAARGVLRYLEQTANHYIAFKLLARIRHQVFAALRRLAPAKLSGWGRGDLVSVITGDIELLEVFYAHTVSPVAIALGVSAAVVALEFALHPALALVAALAFATVGAVAPLAASTAAGSGGREFRSILGSLDAYLLDSLRGLGEAMQYGVARSRGRTFFERSAELSGVEERLKARGGASQAAVSVAVWAFDLVALVVGLTLFQRGDITLAEALVATVLLMSSFGPVLALANLGVGLQQTLAAGERVLSILDEEPAVRAPLGGEVPCGGGVSAEEVFFSYGDEPVLDGVSLTVPEGSITGLTGRSGSGKSTLLALMMRFWDADRGRILVGGADVGEADMHALRSMQGLLTQDTHLFNESLADNIRMGRLDASDAEVEAAARAACIHDTIAGLPQGYATRAGELGDALSAGERQRIGLARALLREAPLLLLDEPTSNLDSLSEAAILRALVAERAGRTVVLVSHRPSTLRVADRVVELDAGRAS